MAVLQERIALEARELRPLRTLITVISAIFWMVGWLAGGLVRGLWFAVAWMWAAAVVGFRDAQKKRSG